MNYWFITTQNLRHLGKRNIVKRLFDRSMRDHKEEVRRIGNLGIRIEVNAYVDALVEATNEE